MKNYKFLALLPVFFLCSCGLGTKLDEDQAKEKMDAIVEKAGELNEDDNYKNAKMTFVSEMVGRDEEDNKVTTKITYKYIVNSDNEMYFGMTTESDGEKMVADLYLANIGELDEDGNPEDQVLYAKVTGFGEGEDQDRAIQRSKNESEFQDYLEDVMDESAGILGRTVVAYSNPYNVKAQDLGDDYDNQTNYYSNGNGNLTIKTTNLIYDDVEVQEGQEGVTTKSIVGIYTYNKNVFESFEMQAVMMNGDKSFSKGSVAYQKAKISINLPRDWESKLDAE